MTGEKIKVADISFDGQDKLDARFWDANVRIDLHKVAALSIQENGPSKCTVLVTTKDGEEMSLNVEGEHIITGQSPVGSFGLRLEKASRIMFAWDRPGHIVGEDGARICVGTSPVQRSGGVSHTAPAVGSCRAGARGVVAGRVPCGTGGVGQRCRFCRSDQLPIGRR